MRLSDYNSCTMSGSLYLHVGVLTPKSLRYVDALRQHGWAPEYVDLLQGDLLRFESASILDEYDDARDIMIHDHPVGHDDFLRSLNRHIKALARAERYEELQNKARTNSKDSIAANVILNGAGRGGGANLHAIKNKGVRLEELRAMSDDDLKRELSAVAQRVNADVSTCVKP